MFYCWCLSLYSIDTLSVVCRGCNPCVFYCWCLSLCIALIHCRLCVMTVTHVCFTAGVSLYSIDTLWVVCHDCNQCVFYCWCLFLYSIDTQSVVCHDCSPHVFYCWCLSLCIALIHCRLCVMTATHMCFTANLCCTPSSTYSLQYINFSGY